jgi:hypothetical protein
MKLLSVDEVFSGDLRFGWFARIGGSDIGRTFKRLFRTWRGKPGGGELISRQRGVAGLDELLGP